MTYMNKKVTFIKSNNKGNFTYITPTDILTTNKTISKFNNNKPQ